jgi:hypothetical protein
MPSITIPWTLSLLGKTTQPNAAGNKIGLLAEFDCELSIKYWGESKYGDYGWELEAVTVEWSTPPQTHVITKQSDPAMWEVIMRGWKADELALSDKIIEEIAEDEDNARYEAPDYEDAVEAYR